MDYASSYERVDPRGVEICSLADNIIGNPDNFMVFVFKKMDDEEVSAEK